MKLTKQPLAMFLIVLLVLSAFIGILAVYAASGSDDFQTVWSYTTSDDCTYDELFLGEDGTVYAEESNPLMPDGRHTDYLVALSSEGELKWRYGVNSIHWPELGPDGGIYYVDTRDVSLLQEAPSQEERINFTVLNTDGSLRWRYLVENSTLDGILVLMDINDDGSVILEEHEGEHNQSTGLYQTITDRMLSFSAQGDLLWSYDLLENDRSMYRVKFANNGTVELYSYGITIAEPLVLTGFALNGSIAYQMEIQDPFNYLDSPDGQNGTAAFEVHKEVIDLDTIVTSAHAINMSDGQVLWKTELSRSGNPNHDSPGSSSWRNAYVDGGNIIYCSAGDDGDETFALDGNGTVLWHKDFQAYPIGVFDDGIMLNGQDCNYLRVDGEGDIIWKCQVTFPGLSYADVTEEGNIVAIQDDQVVELQAVTGTFWSGTALFYMVLTVAVVFLLLALLVLFNRKGRNDRS